MDEIRWVSTTAAAEMLGIQTRTLYRLIDEGQVVAYRFGRVIRLQESDVAAYLESARIEPGTLGHLAVWAEGSRGLAGSDFVDFYEDSANGAGDDVHVDGA